MKRKVRDDGATERAGLEIPEASVLEPFERLRNYPAPLEIETTFKTWSCVDRAVDMAADSADPIERWTAKRRVALVVSILKGETSVVEAARQPGLTVGDIEDWREKFLLGAENAPESSEG